MSVTPSPFVLFDPEPERMARAMKMWWFAAIITAAILFVLCVAGALVAIRPVVSSVEEGPAVLVRPEQKLLDRKLLQEVVRSYEVREKKYTESLTASPIADPSK